jgi:hypothetical protein
MAGCKQNTKNNGNGKNKKVPLLIKKCLEPIQECDWRARKDRSAGRGLDHTDFKPMISQMSCKSDTRLYSNRQQPGFKQVVTCRRTGYS